MSEHSFKTTPLGCVLTASGLAIGCAYIPPAPREMGSEAEQIQSALLHRPAPLFERLLDAFNDNAMPMFLAILIGGFLWGVIRRFA